VRRAALGATLKGWVAARLREPSRGMAQPKHGPRVSGSPELGNSELTYRCAEREAGHAARIRVSP